MASDDCNFVSRCGVKPEPFGNQLGTIRAATGSGRGSPLGGSPPAEPDLGTATSDSIGGVLVLLAVAAIYARRSRLRIDPPRHPYGLTDAELLDCLGPSWSAMTLEEQAAYGPDHPHPSRRSAA